MCRDRTDPRCFPARCAAWFCAAAPQRLPSPRSAAVRARGRVDVAAVDEEHQHATAIARRDRGLGGGAAEICIKALGGLPGAVDEAPLAVAVDVLTEIRRAKSDAQRSMRTEVSRAVVRDAPERLMALEEARDDVIAAGRVQALETSEADEFAVEATLAPE